MSDFYEVDFLPVETSKSGDAIAIRYSIGGIPRHRVGPGLAFKTRHSVCVDVPPPHSRFRRARTLMTAFS